MLTLLDCKNDRGIRSVARVDPSAVEYADKVNEACRRLLDYGDWWATVIKARFAVYSQWITWPRWVGAARFINLCNSPVHLENGWYDFLGFDNSDWRVIGGCYPQWSRLDDGNVSINEVGTAAVFNNVPQTMTNYVLAYIRAGSDAGKTVTIWGTDSNGWPATETLVLADPYVVSSKQYTNIKRVIKDVTTDYVDVYQCDQATPGTLLDMGHYEPGETKAEYRVSNLRFRDRVSCAPSSTTPLTISAMVKLQHIDAVADNDLVSIGNRAAIKLMIMSILKEEASDPQGAEAESTRAIHELNRELENKLPVIQTPIKYDPFSGVNLSSHSVY